MPPLAIPTISQYWVIVKKNLSELVFWKIAGLEFTQAVVIVLATRAIAVRSYTGVGVVEVLFIAQWFYSRNVQFEDDRSRMWSYGFPAYLIGAISGALLALRLTVL